MKIEFFQIENADCHPLLSPIYMRIFEKQPYTYVRVG